MTEPEIETTVATRGAGDAIENRLAAIEHDTRESLELLRSLVALLLAKEAGHEGPRLEDVIAALVAQQREMLAALRLLQADVTAIARQVLDDGGQDAVNGHQTTTRPC